MITGADVPGSFVETVTVGAHPDMLTFTPDGSKLLVANEGERSEDDAGVDGQGSVTIIDLSGATVVNTASFTSFDGQEDALRTEGVRISQGIATSVDVEPEYIAISPDGTKAFVTLQENNAIAIIDIATATVEDIVPLGLKDWSLPQNVLDVSDRDGADGGHAINIGNQPIYTMFMPDAIASYEFNGQTYYVIANEGDDRDDFIDETARVKDLDLDMNVFPNADALQADDQLGRFTVSTLDGNTDADPQFEQIIGYGGRSFSILNSAGEMVFDSGSVMEQAIANILPAFHNANDGDPAEADTRSDKKGPEPEGVTVANIGGNMMAFVTLERASGSIMAFNVTDPDDVQFSGLFTNPGDVSPEGVLVIPGADNSTGKDLLVVSNETSNTLTVAAVETQMEATDAPAFTLQILHGYAETGTLGIETAPIFGALVDKFDDEYNTLVAFEGDTFIPGAWTNAAADSTVGAVVGSTSIGRADIEILNRLGTDVSSLGNHEFDLGSGTFAGALSGADFPFITSNLDFSGDSALRGRADNSLGGTGGDIAGSEAADIAGKIAPRAVVTVGGEKIGIVGLTTWNLLEKTSATGTTVAHDSDPATTDIQEVAAFVQAQVDALQSQGINKIIMVDQLDGISRNAELAPLVTGIDVMVAGGGHERLGDANDVPAAFNGHDANFVGTYPIEALGADGAPVLIVTTDTEFSYLGRLVVQFDANGEIILSNLDNTINGAYAATEATLQEAYGRMDSAGAIIADSAIGSSIKEITDAIEEVVVTKDGAFFGYTSVYLEGDRTFGRAQEVNLGDISADANAEAARAATGEALVVSLKNGGGIRASIGSIDEDGNKVAPEANPAASKPSGAISQLDIENALRFDNKLVTFDTTAAGVQAILEHAASLSDGNGGFPQVGGIQYSYDQTKPAGERVVNAALVDADGVVQAVIIKDGQLATDAPTVIKFVSLNFTANGGDGYPIPANATNFRYLLDDGTLGDAVDATGDIVAQAPANALGEQQAFQDYLSANHGTPGTAFDVVDTPESLDIRIQDLSVREDGVLQGSVINGDGNSNDLAGGVLDDVINGLAGNDIIHDSAGNDVLDGGEGKDTADFSAGDMGRIVDLDGGTAMDNVPAMMTGENGYTVTPLFTVGDTLSGTTGALNSTSAGDYVPVGILDGIGAYALDSDTVRAFVNHELGSTAGEAYALDNGTMLTGARISYFDLAKDSKNVEDAGLAFGTVYDRAGNVVTDGAQVDGGFNRFCSGSLFEGDEFGAGMGIADTIYFAGEENGNGTEWALDVTTGELWAVPDMGRGSWENVTQISTGNASEVAFILGDDTTGGPLYMYKGTKDASGDFLARNGLKDGKLFVLKFDEAGVDSPADFTSGSKTASWVELPHFDASKAGTTGYDALGYKDGNTMRADAASLGAFGFVRTEDVSTDPSDATKVVIATTGGNSENPNGRIYTIDTTFGATDTASVGLLYDGAQDPMQQLRSPDNLDWADDGFIYAQEDRSNGSIFGGGAVNQYEASIVRIDPATGDISRVAEMNRAAVPFGQTDSAPLTDVGNWESSGVVDVSSLFGEAGGSTFLADVQAHGIRPLISESGKNLAEGGQLFVLTGPTGPVPVIGEVDQLISIENATGTEKNDILLGDENANVLSGLGGDDILMGRAGNDVLDGGEGHDTADFSDAMVGRVIDLAAGLATDVGAPAGFVTGNPSMLTGENGFVATPLFTVGDTIQGTTGALNATSAGDYAPVGIPDGIGAYALNDTTIRVFMSHELGNTVGESYELANGTALTGARVSYFDIDKATKTIVDSELAYNTIYDVAGNVVTDPSQINGGFSRFCSSSLFEGDEFGAGRGIVDTLFFTGEENGNGTEWVLDPATGDLWAAPMMGRGSWENVTQISTGNTSHVAFVLGDDSSPGPLYLYIGEKDPNGGFLARNGLDDGKVYALKMDADGIDLPTEFASGVSTATWIEVNNFDPAKAGTAGYDALGYAQAATLRAEAFGEGAFQFARTEDLSTNPENWNQIVFNTTGGTSQNANGRIYVADISFIGGTPRAFVNVLYNGDTDPLQQLRSPDNLDWADDGFIYAQEDRSNGSIFGGDAINQNESSIVRIDPNTGDITRVASVDRTAVPFGQTDSAPISNVGNWESSGILDVSDLFGEVGGTIFLADVQAHGIKLGNSAQVEGGQLAFLTGPGADAPAFGERDALISIENAIGSEKNDILLGNENANILSGLGGNDWFVGNGGGNTLDGGSGIDTASYQGASAGVTVNLATGMGTAGQALGDTYASIENVTGSSYGDLIFGNGESNNLRGLAGNDIFVGSTGGRERYDGGSGSDAVTYFQSASGVVASLSQGYGVGGDAALDLFTSIESLTGSIHDDILTGNGDRNSLRGLNGNDALNGYAGTDYLTGGRGDDEIDGGAGSDYAYFSGNASDFTITKQAWNEFTISWNGPGVGEGTDHLVSVEYFVFHDQILNIWAL